MDKLIQFRSYISNLSKEEHDSFIQSFDREYLSTALFDHLHMELKRTNDISEIEQINNALSAIIEENNKITPTHSILDISDSLLNKIFQYLDAKSYSVFERCNRSLFIIARNPSNFQSDLFLNYINHCTKNHLFVDVEKFRRVKKICIATKGLKLLLQHQFRFSSLHDLQLYFPHKKPDKSTIPLILKCSMRNLIDLNNIKTLNVNASIEIQNLLPHIPSLQFLKFFEINQIRFDDEVGQHVPKLQGVCLLETGNLDQESCKSLYSLCGSKLRSFHADVLSNKFDIELFNNLEELCFSIPKNGPKSYVQIIRQCKETLRRVHMHDPGFGGSIPFTSDIINVLFECEALDCVSINIWSDSALETVIKLIQRALLMHKKQSFKIKIQCNSDEVEDEDIDALCLDLVLFINALPFLVLNDFMFIFGDSEWSKFEEQLKQRLSDLDSTIFDVKFGGRYFVVINKGCKLGGYSDQWIYAPDCCECNHTVS